MTTTTPVPAHLHGDALFAALPSLTNEDLPHLTQAQQHELADHGAIGGYWNNGRPGWTWTINPGWNGDPEPATTPIDPDHNRHTID